MRLSKKGQGMPLNVIVIAIIVLIVLVVMIFIFGGGIGKFRTGLTQCDGGCAASANDCYGKGMTPVYQPGCKGTGTSTGNYCCTQGAT